MRLRQNALSLLALAVAAVPLPAQQRISAGTQPIPTLHSTARVVVLDVVVSDGKGTPAKGLKQSDFTLYEDNVPQTLLSFTEHDAVVGTMQAPSLPANTFAVQPPITGDGAVTVVVFGRLAPADAPWARKQLQNYLSATQPGMPMAIVREDNGTHLIQPLTSDRSVLLAAVSSDRVFSAKTPAPIAGLRPTFNLQRYLGDLQGHVNLIWFSTGGGARPFPDIFRFVDNASVLQLSRIALFPMDAQGMDFYNSGVGESLPGVNGHAFTGVVGGVMGPVGPGSTFGAGGPTFLNSANGPVGDLATQNGGRAYHSNHTYVPAITDVVNTGSHYYTLSYTPTNPNWNGQYRSIRLDVPGYSIAPHGVLGDLLGLSDKNEGKLMYRRGYYARGAAPPPGSASPVQRTDQNPQRRLLSTSHPATQLKRAPPSAMQTALAFASPTPLALRFSVTLAPQPETPLDPATAETTADSAPPAADLLSAPFQSLPSNPYRIHYRIDPSQLTLVAAADGSYNDNLQFAAVVYSDNGIEANSLVSPGHITVAAADYGRTIKAPFSFDQIVAIPSGSKFFLRIAVRELLSDRIGALELPVAELNPQTQEPQVAAKP